jgi:hypothetical protein
MDGRTFAPNQNVIETGLTEDLQPFDGPVDDPHHEWIAAQREPFPMLLPGHWSAWSRNATVGGALSQIHRRRSVEGRIKVG